MPRKPEYLTFPHYVDPSNFSYNVINGSLGFHELKDYRTWKYFVEWTRAGTCFEPSEDGKLLILAIVRTIQLVAAHLSGPGP